MTPVRIVSVVLSAALAIHPVVVQAQQAEAAYGEVLDVRVANVDVIARDAKGNPVTGLTRGDFEIYEDGKRQEITNFSEVTATAPRASAAAPVAGEGVTTSPRKFIFYIDNGSLTVENRNAVFPAIEKFVETSLLPGDQIMIASWNKSMQVRLPWTSDHTAVSGTLKKLAGELGGNEELQAERRRVDRLLHDMEKDGDSPASLGPARSQSAMITFDMTAAAARTYAEKVRYDVALSVGALTKLLGSLSGVEGKKVLVLATESLPMRAGAGIFAALENIRIRAGLSATSALGSGAKRGSAITDLSSNDLTSVVESLARAANATGVTVYALNPKGMDQQKSGTVELSRPSEMTVEFANTVEALDGVNVLAQRTGGKAMVGAPASLALAQMAEDLSSYYSIGYRARPGTAPERKIEVRTTRKGVTVRSRNTIYYRSLGTEMADRVLANHLQSELANAMNVAVEADPVTQDGARKLLPVRIIIPADSLTLLPDAEGNVTGGFSVFTSSGTATAGGTGVDVQTQQIRWPAAQAAQMKGRRIGFAVQVPMDANPTQISVGVIDHVSQAQGFAKLVIAGQ